MVDFLLCGFVMDMWMIKLDIFVSGVNIVSIILIYDFNNLYGYGLK